MATPLGDSDIHRQVRYNRRPWGCAAVLLPHRADGSVDWPGFEDLLLRTVEAGLTPAVNMDTGFVQLLDSDTRSKVLATTSATLSDRISDPTVTDAFLSGAFVSDNPGDTFDPTRYLAELDSVAEAGGTPVVFPSYGLNGLEAAAWVDAHNGFASSCGRFVAFELGPQFVPYGRIYPIDAYRELLTIDECIGAKHSSLSRDAEWARLALRDQIRPDFHVFTGNDLAIDMICWGSDYLLGLAAFAPDQFAARDEAWATGDTSFYELNDILQYLGAFAFRDPVPAYRHDAAMFLTARGWIQAAEVPGGAPTRPRSDLEVLTQIADKLDRLSSGFRVGDL